MYGKCGSPDDAEMGFNDIIYPNVFSWNAMIAVFSQQGSYNKAFNVFNKMTWEGVIVDKVTFHSILSLCTKPEYLVSGKWLHTLLITRGIDSDVLLGNALINMYAKCGSLEAACKVFDNLPNPNHVSYGGLITAYVQHGQGSLALQLFAKVQSKGITPNKIIYICVLKACTDVRDSQQGKVLHDQIVRSGFESDVTIANTLVDMYAKCGLMGEARRVFDQLTIRTTVSWGAMIAGYVQHGQCHEALSIFEQMQKFHEQCLPNVITFVCILMACGNIGAIENGKQIHDEIVSRKLLDTDIILGTALVDMYAKCGVLAKAQEIFEDLKTRNIIAWNALITGYAQQGQGHEALNCVKCMQCEGISLNEVTFLCILNACSHSGLLYEAQMHFIDMAQKYSLQPNIEHYTCMVVVFGHAGLFEKAVSVIKTISSGEYPSGWLALLGACRKWGNVKLGKLAFDEVLLLDNGCAAAYTLMANIYASAGMEEDAEKIEAMRVKIEGPLEVEEL